MSGPAGPSGFDKASLAVGRAIHYPFAVPKRMTDSAMLVGNVGHNLVGTGTQAIAQSLLELQPRFGGATIAKVGNSILQGTAKSQQMAARNTEVFWGPLGDGVDQIGHAVSAPFAYRYAKKSGLETDRHTLAALVHKGYQPPQGPEPAPAGEPAPAPAAAPPQGAGDPGAPAPDAASAAAAAAG